MPRNSRPKPPPPPPKFRSDPESTIGKLRRATALEKKSRIYIPEEIEVILICKYCGKHQHKKLESNCSSCGAHLPLVKITDMYIPMGNK